MMQYSSLRAVIFGLVALAGTTSATVSLASFIPRIDNLPTQCANVYNARIEGCTADDFKSTATCSSACVQGLVKITEAVAKDCINVDAGETSIIGVFQNGLGIQALCPGVTVTIISSTSSSTTVAAQTSTSAVASTTSTTSTTSTSETTTSEPSSTSSGGLITDPGATGTFVASTVNAPATSAAQPSSAEPQSSASASQKVNSQLSNSDSGGGSPFDVVATGSSSRLRVIDVSVASLLATSLLFVAWA